MQRKPNVCSCLMTRVQDNTTI